MQNYFIASILEMRLDPDMFAHFCFQCLESRETRPGQLKKVASKRLDVLNAALKTGHRRRWPLFVLLSSGLFLLRVAQRTFAGLLFQLRHEAHETTHLFGSGTQKLISGQKRFKWEKILYNE
jgi:hypothetical protein